MTNNKVYILLDRSGSMNSMWEEAIGGINGYVKSLETSADIMVAVFDTLSYDVIRNTSKEEWTDLSSTEVTPRGGTPLLDASARIMHNMIDSGAKKAILIIVTDGYENNSTKFNKNEIMKLTKDINEKYDYEMVFLGANFDKVSEVANHNFGFNDIKGSATRSYSASVKNFGATMTETATASSGYFNNGKSADFYSQETLNKLNEKK